MMHAGFCKWVLCILLGLLGVSVLVFVLFPSRFGTRFAGIERSFVANQQSSHKEELTDYPEGAVTCFDGRDVHIAFF